MEAYPTGRTLASRWAHCAKWVVMLLAGASLSTGCYFVEMSQGQLSLINEQRRLSRALTQEPDAQRRALLQQVPDILAFARDVLGLSAGGSYRGYIDVHSHGLTHVLVASKKTRFEPFQWWFPFTGTIDYKSFFDEQSALSEAEELSAKDYDVYIGSSRAYSTLGYLRDPVTSTMLEGGLTGLSEVLFHELAHQRLFFASKTDWNEQFASFVAQKSCERYFAQQKFKTMGLDETWRRSAARSETARELVKATVEVLQALYDSGLPEAEKLRRREGIFADLSKNLTALHPEQDGRRVEVNNAVLLQFARYDEAAPLFEPLWQACRGNFNCFYAAAEAQAQVADETPNAEDNDD